MTERQEKLEAILETIIRDKERSPRAVSIMLEIAEMIAGEDHAQSLELSVEAEKIAEELSYAEGQCQAMGIIGFVEYLSGNHERALKKIHGALKLVDGLDIRMDEGRLYSVLAMLHRSMGQFDKALSYAFKSQRIIEGSTNRYWAASAQNLIGAIYHDLGDFNKSLESHQASLDAVRKIDPSEIPEPMVEARALSGLGTVHQSLGEYERACEYHLESLELFRKRNDRLGESRALNDLGEIYIHRQDFKCAIDNFSRSLAIRREIGAKQAQGTSLTNIGRLQLAQGQIAEAKETLNEALKIVEETGSKPKIFLIHQVLSQAYEEEGDSAKALSHYKLFETIKDEVLGENSAARIKNLQIAHEVEQSEKEAEISRLKNVELKEANQQLEDALRDLQETQSQLIQSEKMAALGGLTAGLVHEMNSPLGALGSATDVASRCLTSLSEQIKSGSIPEQEEIDRSLTLIERLKESQEVATAASGRLQKIVSGLKTFTRLDQAELQKTDIHEGLDAALALIGHTMKDRIDVHRQYGDIPQILCYAGELNQMFLNVLTNAVQAIVEDGAITLTTSVSNGTVLITISDDGIGIPSEQLERLFEPRFSAKGSRVKSGMGLFTSYQIIKKHGGRIEANSEQGVGTTFSIHLPVDGAPGAWA